MDLILAGFAVALSPENLLYCFVGVTLGTFIGVLPGIGALAGISMLLPVTFYLEPLAALIMLAGVYYGCEYGGSTASILLNLPGTAANAVTCLDGYPMARQGRAGVALLVTALSSFVGGCIGIVLMMALSPAIVVVALSFGASEFFAFMLLGLFAAAGAGSGGLVRGLAMVFVGVLLGCVGVDINSGVARYNFGIFSLYDGISIVIIAMGMFGVAELIFAMVHGDNKQMLRRVTLRSMLPTRDDTRRLAAPTLRGTGIGAFIGVLPGVGATLASLLAYVAEKRVARDPSRFGKGAVEGIAAPEAANNAAAQTAFIPTLALGVPGSATMAVMLGALTIHGISAGPLLMTNHPEMFWGLIASFWIGNVLLLVLNIPLIGVWVRILQVPFRLLYPVILVLVCMGVYSLHGNVFDIWLLLIVGVVGYFMRLTHLEPAPLLMGFILGPMIEENFRRALIIGRGDYLVLFKSPISATVYLIMAAILAWILWNRLAEHRRRASPA